MGMRLLTAAVVTLLAAGSACAPPMSAPASSGIEAAVAALPGIVDDVRATTGAPGVAVAVVQGDRTLMTRGFGVRDLRTGAPVTADTVFQLASLSKPVSASVIAAATDTGAVQWSDPVVAHLPGFELRNPATTAAVTIGDLLAHRSGLPGDSGNDLEAVGFDQRSIIRALRYEPLAPFRTSYAYSNFGFTTGALAAAAATGSDWSALARRLILGPVGMSHSSYSYADFIREPDHVTLSVRTASGGWVAGGQRDPDAQAPAGGLSSSVTDMAAWMRMELAGGRIDGRQVVSTSALAEALTVQSHTVPRQDPRTGYGYGMNLVVHPSGDLMWTHSGAFTTGASTRLLMIPSRSIGIVVLTNAAPIGVPESIAAAFTDVLYSGAVGTDWLAHYGAELAHLQPTFRVDGRAKPERPEPARLLVTYAGTYSSPYVGPVRVSSDGRGLWASFSSGLRFELRHWDGDVFYFELPDQPPGFYLPVRFGGAPRATTAAFDLFNSALGELRRR